MYIINLINHDKKSPFHERDTPAAGTEIINTTNKITATLLDVLSLAAGRGGVCTFIDAAFPADLWLAFLFERLLPPKDVENDIPVPGIREVTRIFPVELSPTRKVFPPTEELKLFFPRVNLNGPFDLLFLNLIAIMSRPYLKV
jgi:hypothetical protein